MKIPAWNEYYSTLAKASVEQRAFYEYWLGEYNKGIIIDIDGNFSYLFVYIEQLVKQFTQNLLISELINSFDQFLIRYKKYEKKFTPYLISHTLDAYLLIKDYNNAWQTLLSQKEICRKLGNIYSGINSSDIFNIKSRCSDPYVNADDVVSVLGQDDGLTEFGKKNINEVLKLVNVLLNSYQYKYGCNLLIYFAKEYVEKKLYKKDLKVLGELINDNKKFEELSRKYTGYEVKLPRRFNRLLFGDPRFTQEVVSVPSIVDCAVKNQLRNVMREAENTYREEQGVPHIGEGWVKETELFNYIKEKYTKFEVVHHGRPVWLGRQHLDVFFPKLMIAIEYQGAQHNKPVGIFGGEKGFMGTLARDEKKKRLCEQNNCKLMYVYEHYTLDEIKRMIDSIIR